MDFRFNHLYLYTLFMVGIWRIHLSLRPGLLLMHGFSSSNSSSWQRVCVDAKLMNFSNIYFATTHTHTICAQRVVERPPVDGLICWCWWAVALHFDSISPTKKDRSLQNWCLLFIERKWNVRLKTICFRQLGAAARQLNYVAAIHRSSTIRRTKAMIGKWRKCSINMYWFHSIQSVALHSSLAMVWVSVTNRQVEKQPSESLKKQKKTS